jgi:hypothetical protein
MHDREPIIAVNAADRSPNTNAQGKVLLDLRVSTTSGYNKSYMLSLTLGGSGGLTGIALTSEQAAAAFGDCFLSVDINSCLPLQPSSSESSIMSKLSLLLLSTKVFTGLEALVVCVTTTAATSLIEAVETSATRGGKGLRRGGSIGGRTGTCAIG